MTNKISSVEEAISALIKLKAKSVPVRVNLGFPNTAFSIEGLVSGVDVEYLEVRAFDRVSGKTIALFRIAPLSKFEFFGEFDENEVAISLSLAIAREGTFNNMNMPRTHLNAQWPTIQEYPSAIH